MMSMVLSHGHWQEIVRVGDRVVQLPGHDGNWCYGSPIYGQVIINRENRLCVRVDARHKHIGGNAYYLDSTWRKVEVD